MNCKLLLFCAFSTLLFYQTIFSQEENRNSKSESFDKTNQQSEHKLLSKNGICDESIHNIISFSNDDLNRILTFDFSVYRNYSTTQKVQIENGPLIELMSIQSMIQKGFAFDDYYLLEKKNIDKSNVTHEIIPIVHLVNSNLLRVNPKK